jgi:hypothetical protein
VKAKYDWKADTLEVDFVSIEVLDASKRVDAANNIPL